MSCGGSLTSCARGAGGSVAFLDRKQRSNAPKAKTLAIRTQADGVDFGGSGKGGDGAGVIETQTFSGSADSRWQPNRRRLLCRAPEGFAWQRFVAIDYTIGAGQGLSKRRRQWYLWKANSRPGSGRPDVEANFVAIVLWLLFVLLPSLAQG
jgi:hypothetical protein